MQSTRQAFGHFQIRPMISSDAPTVASLHMRVFPEYFLTHMGPRFLTRFYRQFTEHPGYGFVALCNGVLVGMVAGASDTTQLRKRFYWENFIPLILITLQRIVTHLQARRMLLSRASYVVDALWTLAGRLTGHISSNFEPTSEGEAHLLSIGVDLEFRGHGIANELVNRFCDELAQDEVDAVRLSVFLDNESAIQFYEKTGWQIERTTETFAYLIRPTRLPGRESAHRSA